MTAATDKTTIDAIVARLKDQLKRADTPANRINYQQFFKETLAEPIGLRTPVLRDISKRVYAEIKQFSKDDILKLGDVLLESGMRYANFFAFEWALKVKRHYEPSDFARFERWLKTYVNGWGSCDHLCCGPLGQLILKFPELSDKTIKWAGSKSRWLRRASAVSLIVAARKGLLEDRVFETADRLLVDPDDLVQKGYGWMLKEASKQFNAEVFAYVLKHKAEMPRTALRYAIEKYPPAKRRLAMAKD